jgi:hypothetical protein
MTINWRELREVFMNNFSKIALAICAVLCAIGGWFVYTKMYGSQPSDGSSGVPELLPAILVVSGLASAAIGAQGYLRAKSSKTATPLIQSLNFILGALALLMALFFLLP